MGSPAIRRTPRTRGLQPKGFVWDAAEKKGLGVKIYGEYVEYAWRETSKQTKRFHDGPS